MKSNNIYQEGKEKCSIRQIVGENLLIVLHMAVGMFSMWKVKILGIPMLSIGYSIFLLFMLLFYLRKHMCTHCYYYSKSCHCGWGKLALMYKNNSGNIQRATRMAGLVWGVLMGIPIVVTLILTIIDFNFIKVATLVMLIALLILQSVIHKKDCGSCKMRNICKSR